MVTSQAEMGAFSAVGESAAASGAHRLVRAWLSGKSPATIDSYGRDLASFARFVGASDAARAAEMFLGGGYGAANSLAFDYRAHLLARKVAPNTVNRHLTSLKSLTKVARMMGLIPWALEVPRVRAPAHGDMRGPGREGFLCMLAKARERGDAKGARDCAFLRLLYERGLRIGEVVGLDLADVDLKRGAVNVLGKGRPAKEWLTLASTSTQAVAAWVAIRGDEPGPLFPRFSHAFGPGRMTRQGGYRMVRELGAAVGLKVRPHGLRHSAITAALEAGLDVRSVQRFSRHKNLQTLLIYDDCRRDIGGEVARAISEPDPSPLPTGAHPLSPPRLRRAKGATPTDKENHRERELANESA